VIALPPGCTVTYAVWIDIKEMTNDIVDWFELVGGRKKVDKYYNHRGKEVSTEYVAYGKAKWCHYHQNGNGGIRIHFHGDDASVASMFLLKFMDVVAAHNLKEVQDRIEYGFV
jgi:hypothetical protein